MSRTQLANEAWERLIKEYPQYRKPFDNYLLYCQGYINGYHQALIDVGADDPEIQ